MERLSRRGRIAVLVALALLGLVVAAGVSLAASRLSSQHIGLSSEPLTAGERLAPAEHATTSTTTRTTSTKSHHRSGSKTTTVKTVTTIQTTRVVIPPTTRTAQPPPPRDDSGGSRHGHGGDD
jgi:hypothetical protein